MKIEPEQQGGPIFGHLTPRDRKLRVIAILAAFGGVIIWFFKIVF